MRLSTLGLLVTPLFALTLHELHEIANIINSKLPAKVDQHTLFTTCVAKPNRLVQTYVVTSFTRNAFDVKRQKSVVSKKQRKLCHHPGFQQLFDQNITLEYHYRDKTLQSLFHVDLTPDECALINQKLKK